MTTDQLLNLDCTKEENKNKIRNALFKAGIFKTKYYTFEELEEKYHGLCMSNSYDTQGIKPYYENNVFIYYVSSIVVMKNEEGHNSRHWVGNVYGKTFQEVLEKSIIKIYADIKKGGKKNE